MDNNKLPMFCKDLLSRFTEMSREVLADNLVGIYLHGSSAMGCFNPEKSDLDLILVVKNDIPDAVKVEFIKNVVKFNAEAPPKGFELSIVKRKFCKPFVYPTPYELHFSGTYLEWCKENPEDFVEKLKGTDKDLAAHFTIINQYGMVLFGEEIKEVFGEVPKQDYIDSIRYDVENACEDILENPMYIILNLCRVLAYLRENLILSKKAGGEWGLKELPGKFHGLIQLALHCYETEEEMAVDSEAAIDFANDMLRKAEEYYVPEDCSR